MKMNKMYRVIWDFSSWMLFPHHFGSKGLMGTKADEIYTVDVEIFQPGTKW